MQLLFQLDLNPPENIGDVFEPFWEAHEADSASKGLTEDLVKGTRFNQDEIDDQLKRSVENWDLSRVGSIERSVLRLATYEMLYRRDIPPVVSINEAVDLAKYFGSRESGKFVNGVLDRIRKGVKRPTRKEGGGARTGSKHRHGAASSLKVEVPEPKASDTGNE